MDSSFLQVAVLFHEAFHTYQSKRFHGGIGSEEPPPIHIVADPQFRARLHIEWTLLADAIGASDVSRAKQLAREYLAVRADRTMLFPSGAISDANVERHEGSAHWVGYRSAAAVAGLSPRALVELQRRDLVRPNVTFPVAHYRSLLYATGSAMVGLLDRFGALSRSAIEQGAAPADLLKLAVGDGVVDLEGVYEQRGLKRLLAEATAPPALDNQVLASFEDSSQPRIIIEGFRPISVSGTGAQVSPQRQVTIFLSPHPLTIEGADFNVRIDELPAQLDSRGGVMRLTVLVDRLPPAEVGPNALQPNGWLRVSGINLHPDGAAISINRSAMILVETTKMTIRIE